MSDLGIAASEALVWKKMPLLGAAMSHDRRIAIKKGACDVESGSKVLGASDGGELVPVGGPPSAAGRPADEPIMAALG